MKDIMTFSEAVELIIKTGESIPEVTTVIGFNRSEYPIIQECENYKMYKYSDDVMIIEEFPERDCSYIAVLDSEGDDIGEIGYCNNKIDSTVINS